MYVEICALKKAKNCAEIVNNDAREHELHSTRQELSNNSSGHDIEWVCPSLVGKYISNSGVGNLFEWPKWMGS